jgi:hypothetical protein
MVYNIKNTAGPFSTGVTGDKRQVLMGIQSHELIAVFFDSKGHLLEVQVREISGDRTNEALLEWKRAIRYKPKTITVRKFFLYDRYIGIEVFPRHFSEFLENPNDPIYDDQQRLSLSSEITKWGERGDFVVWWNEEYWVDKKGEGV